MTQPKAMKKYITIQVKYDTAFLKTLPAS